MNLFNAWKSLFRVLVEKLETNIPFNVIPVLLHYNKISKFSHIFSFLKNLHVNYIFFHFYSKIKYCFINHFHLILIGQESFYLSLY